jgi:hypothetical protein
MVGIKKHDHVVEGEIFETRSGLEAIRFRLDLGVLSFHFIVNIPEVNRVKSLIFVKIRVH